MPEDLKPSQIGSSQLPPPFRGIHSPGVRKHCQIIFACYFGKSSVSQQFPETCGITNYGSVWRKGVINPCLEFGTAVMHPLRADPPYPSSSSSCVFLCMCVCVCVWVWLFVVVVFVLLLLFFGGEEEKVRVVLSWVSCLSRLLSPTHSGLRSEFPYPRPTAMSKEPTLPRFQNELLLSRVSLSWTNCHV